MSRKDNDSNANDNTIMIIMIIMLCSNALWARGGQGTLSDTGRI